MQACQECGFAWETVAEDQIGARAVSGAAAIAHLLGEHARIAARRPSPDRWSMLEYAAHVRDVLLHVRDRLVVGLVEDDPELNPPPTISGSTTTPPEG